MVARSCIKCGVVIPRGSRCAQCKSPRPPKKTSHYKDPEYIRNRCIMIEDAWRLRLPCWICGEPFRAKKSITADHVVPLSKGGTHKVTNLAPAHFLCNSRRGASSVVTPR